MRVLLAACALALAGIAGISSIGGSTAAAAEPSVSSLGGSPVTVYGAKWCSACKTLEAALRDRKISFEEVDVDENGAAFARARNASGQGSAIPLTSVIRSTGTVWIVGADVDAIDRAQRD